eukprot:scaffold3274_cov244-Pinguiococcus_pyrenoidosus.AAC.8
MPAVARGAKGGGAGSFAERSDAAEESRPGSLVGSSSRGAAKPCALRFLPHPTAQGVGQALPKRPFRATSATLEGYFKTRG